MLKSLALLNRIFVAALFASALMGCGSIGGNSLPDTVTVQLPDGTEVEASLGAGVASLADSRWQFYQNSANGQSLPFIVIAFGPNGELDRFEDNTIASEIFGDEIVFDGNRHATQQQGLSYAAATYGAETSDSTGFAFEGQLTAFAAGFTAATATAAAQGTFDPENPDRMFGTFSFTTRVLVPNVPNGNTDESFDFVAERIIEE